MADVSGNGIVSRSQLLTHQQAHPLVISALLTQTWGRSWIYWDPQALWTEIERTYDVKLPELTKAKVQAIRTMEVDYRFWSEWDIFCPVVAALNNRIPNFWIIQKPELTQVYAAVDIASRVRTRPYSDDVARFIVAVFLDSGVVCAPPPLDFVQGLLDRPMYTCKDCGQQASDDGNRVCDSCGSDDLTRYNVNNDSSEVITRLEQILSGSYDELQETPSDIQAAKLSVALNYMGLRRDQLKQQLVLLEHHA